MPITWYSAGTSPTPTCVPTMAGTLCNIVTVQTVTSCTTSSSWYAATNQSTNQVSHLAQWYHNQLADGLFAARQAVGNARWLAERKAAEEQREQDAYLKAIREHDQQEIDRIERERAERERVRIAAVEEQRRINAERERATAERDAARKAANERAGEFLSQHLSPSQRETFLKNGWFIVEGGKSKTRYRIRGNTLMANVDVLDNKDKVTHRLCAHPRLEACPVADHLLAQKMTLEFDEDSFLRTANRHA